MHSDVQRPHVPVSAEPSGVTLCNTGSDFSSSSKLMPATLLCHVPGFKVYHPVVDCKTRVLRHIGPVDVLAC